MTTHARDYRVSTTFAFLRVAVLDEPLNPTTPLVYSAMIYTSSSEQCALLQRLKVNVRCLLTTLRQAESTRGSDV